jgi:hypothetical protein
MAASRDGRPRSCGHANGRQQAGRRRALKPHLGLHWFCMGNAFVLQPDNPHLQSKRSTCGNEPMTPSGNAGKPNFQVPYAGRTFLV